MTWSRPGWNCPAARCCPGTWAPTRACSPSSTSRRAAPRAIPGTGPVAGIPATGTPPVRTGTWTAAAARTAGAADWDASGPPALSPWQARLLCRQVAQDCIRHAREAGNVPAGLLRWAEQTLQPAVDWRRVLAAELRRAVADTAGAVDYSYRRPSRRAPVAGPVVLPALRRPVPEVAVVCDTSGSMTEDLLAAALAEVEGLLRSLGLARQVRVLACDTAVGAVRRVTSARQVELVGGGGTDMGAGIDAAAALRPRPAVTVVLTDGFTPVAGPAAAGHPGRGRPARRRRAGRPGLGPGRPGARRPPDLPAGPRAGRSRPPGPGRAARPRAGARAGPGRGRRRGQHGQHGGGGQHRGQPVALQPGGPGRPVPGRIACRSQARPAIAITATAATSAAFTMTMIP